MLKMLSFKRLELYYLFSSKFDRMSVSGTVVMNLSKAFCKAMVLLFVLCVALWLTAAGFSSFVALLLCLVAPV